MDIGLKTLSDITSYSKYAKYLPEVQRRETWEEIVDRYCLMMVKKYPNLRDNIWKYSKYILNKKVLPSMRALQFAGLAADVNNARIYNCAFLPVDSIHSFSETMFLLLGGSGVGFSVQKHNIDKLPNINIPTKKRRYLVQDSIIGWADAIKALMKAYLDGHSLPDFDFRDIRPKGARLITAGGKAPGPEPLKMCLLHIQAILDRKKDGDRLTSLECHDIQCHIANAVLAGGIRRSAMISLFDLDDEEMLTCKYGNWWELNEQRGRANNSAVLVRDKVSGPEFFKLWEKIELSGSGEPGFYWTNDKDWGTNPCCEIALRPYQFCNLCEVNVNDIDSQGDLNDRVEAAAFFGTLQAGFTDFHYLRPIWKKTTEKDSLLGIGMTGIGSGEILKYDLKIAAEIAERVNDNVSKWIGINSAARITTIKPSGTTSCILGTSSGIHAWHDEHYLRTIRFSMNEEIAQYLIDNHPELCEHDKLRSDTLCVRIPVKAPEGSIFRSESAIDTLERVKKFSLEWVKNGHVNGVNTHNVSATISIDKNRKYYTPFNEYDQEYCGEFWWDSYPYKTPIQDENGYEDEWSAVGGWMWKNRNYYNGLSVLPYDNGSYIQAPFETITKEEYEKRVSSLVDLDLTKVVEFDDNVNFGQTEACAGGKCEIN